MAVHFTAAGTYSIQAGVANGGDSGVDSFLELDAIEVAHGSMLIANSADVPSGPAAISPAEVTTLGNLAAQIWATALGLSAPIDVIVRVVDLPRGQLGVASHAAPGSEITTVLIDSDADGLVLRLTLILG